MVRNRCAMDDFCVVDRTLRGAQKNSAKTHTLGTSVGLRCCAPDGASEV